MALADLEGMELDLENPNMEYKIAHGKRVRIEKEISSFCDQSFRPLVLNGIDGSVGLGRPFAATLNIHHSIHLPAMPTELPASVKDSYAKKPQMEGLTVHAVPIGSRSTVKEVQQRATRMVPVERTAAVKDEGEEVVEVPAVAVKTKAPHSAALAVAHALKVEEGQEEGKKKHKKEKKDKKDKKRKHHQSQEGQGLEDDA